MRRSVTVLLCAWALVVSACSEASAPSGAPTPATAVPVGSLAADGSTVAIGGPTSVSADSVPTDPAATPTVPTPAPPSSAAVVPVGCEVPGDVAVIDRDNQRVWTCTDGVLTREFPGSTAWSQPDPGTYQVYAKDPVTWSKFGGHTTTLNQFVAFSYGKQTGARIAFHAIPVMGDGSLVQPVESVGDLARRGESAGCIRLRPDDADWVWQLLDIGETVVVLN